MGILFDKDPVESVPVSNEPKPFSLYVDKYKTVVAILSIKVNDKDDCMLDIEFDHTIEAPEGEVAAEVGRLIIEKLEASVALLDKAVMVNENEKVDGESV